MICPNHGSVSDKNLPDYNNYFHPFLLAFNEWPLIKAITWSYH